jgi:dGTP triphosphohydrolase
MTTEDNYNKPARTIADWIALGYTEAYAKALYAQQKRAEQTKFKL